MIYLSFVGASLLASLLESVSYLGFFHNHVGIHSFIIYSIGIVSSLLATSYSKPIKNIFKYLTISISILFVILIFLENSNYPNFVFTTTHLNPVTLEIFVTLTWFHYLIISKNSILKSLLIAMLVFACMGSAGKTVGIVYKGLKNVLSDPFATYDQKMAKSYPGFYPAMQQVKGLTPEDSTILIPPQGNPWEVEGNMAMVNYFLYPRAVANLDPDKIGDFGDNTYILIAKGSWPRTGETDYGWPKVKVKAQRIWEFDIASGTSKMVTKDYDPSTDNFGWGLIEVKHD